MNPRKREEVMQTAIKIFGCHGSATVWKAAMELNDLVSDDEDPDQFWLSLGRDAKQMVILLVSIAWYDIWVRMKHEESAKVN